MSIRDARLLMCDGTAVTGSPAAAALKGDYIDFGAQRDYYDTAETPDVGEGGNLWWTAKVTTAIAGASSVVTVALYSHTTAAVASGSALLTATATAGATANGTTLIRAKLPAGTINRYVGTVVTIASAAVSAGAIDSWISIDSETPK